jgi:hypothetical protein
MRAAAVQLGRARDNDGPIGLLYVPTLDRRPKRALSFKEAGLSFIELRQAHLDFMSAIYGRWVPPLEQCTGRALVDHYYLPVGVLLVHHEPGGAHWLMAHFGKWLRIYPKDILRSIKEVCNSLRARGIYELHCSADESVAGSEKLARWLRGEPTGERNTEGPIFRLDLRKTPI